MLARGGFPDVQFPAVVPEYRPSPKTLHAIGRGIENLPVKQNFNILKPLLQRLGNMGTIVVSGKYQHFRQSLYMVTAYHE